MSGSKRKLMDTTGLGRVWRRMKGFRKDEGGTMLVFGVSMFVMMLWAGGMAIDFMRFEHDRARMQYTLDRAALAAASLNQPLNCEDVARDYFEKAGLDTTQVLVRGNCNELSKIVKVGAETEVKSLFLNLLGITSMTAGGESTAEESVQDVEISLVLDVSGSMGWDAEGGTKSKLEALQEATQEFLDILLIDDNADRVSINIIPYNMQVNAGEDVLNLLNVTDEHSYSNCIDFVDADFDTVEISDDVAGGGGGASLGDLSISSELGGGVMGAADDLQRTGHFDPYYTTRNHPNITSDDNATQHFVCPITDFSEIMLMSQTKSALMDKINDFRADGNTSIDIGVKWGAYFLNPSSNVLIGALPEGSSSFSPDGEPVTEMVDGVEVETEQPRRLPTAFGERPYAYDRPHTLKFLIVMTDGQNTTQYTLDEDYASGPSTLWWDPNVDGSHSGNDSTWLSHYKQRPGPNNDYFISRGNYYNDYFSDTRRHSSHDEQLEWPEVWNMMGVKYLSYYYFYARDWDADAYYDNNDDIMNYVYSGTKNARLKAICAAAKGEDLLGNKIEDAPENIRVFTIGFEVSTNSADVMEDCASREGDYFDVAGEGGIKKAFGQIAQTIQRLKLTN